jgi:hypothetical protein
MTDKPMFSIVREVSRHAGAAVAEGLFEGRRAAIKKFSSHQVSGAKAKHYRSRPTAGAPVPRLLWEGSYNDSHILIQSWVEGTPGIVAFRAAQGEDRAKLVDLAALTHASMCQAVLEAPEPKLDIVHAVTGGGAGKWPQLLAAQSG